MQQDSYHGSIHPLAYVFGLIILAEFASYDHRSAYWIEILHLELLKHLPDVFILGDKSNFTELKNM